MLKEGRELIKDEHHIRCPTTTRTDAQVAKVKKVLDSDRSLTIALISEDTIHTIVREDLAMRKVCAKLVPKVLSWEQKLLRVEILDCIQEDEVFFDVITGDQ